MCPAPPSFDTFYIQYNQPITTCCVCAWHDWKTDFYSPQRVRRRDKGGLTLCECVYPPGRQLLEVDTFHYCPASHGPGNKLLIVLLPEGRWQGQQKGSQPVPQSQTQPFKTKQTQTTQRVNTGNVVKNIPMLYFLCIKHHPCVLCLFELMTVNIAET